MMKSFLVALVALLGVFLARVPEPQETKVKEQAAGPVVNGLQLGLSADKTETFIPKDGKNAKPVALRLTFTNVSAKAIKLNAYDFPFSRIRGEVKASAADSVEVQRIATDRTPAAPKAEDFPEIRPGQTWSFDKNLTFPGSIPEGLSTFALYSVVKPGEFRVKFTYASPKGNISPLAENIWTGELVSNELVINVTALAGSR